MSDVPPLHGLDLNLLVTLRALLRASSVTRAADALGQTQPRVSRALATLRVAFDDPLLVRAGRAMTLTPLAASLRTPLERSLGAIDRLAGVGAFDPTTARRTFRVVMNDIVATPILGALGHELADAPGIDIQVRSSERDVLPALLDDEVDLVVHAVPLTHAELYTRVVGGPVGWHAAFGRSHPSWSPGALDRDAWLASEHVQLIPFGRPDQASHFDRVLAEQGLSRAIRFQVSTVFAVAPLLAAGPYVATLPTTVSRHLGPPDAVRLVDHPFAELLPGFRLRMTWHAVHHRDSGHGWLRALVARAIEAAIPA